MTATEEAAYIALEWLADLEELAAAGQVSAEEYRDSVRGLLRRLRSRIPTTDEEALCPAAQF